MDGKIDTEGLHSPVWQALPIQQGAGVGQIISGRNSCSDDVVDGAHGKRDDFQSHGRQGKRLWLLAHPPTVWKPLWRSKKGIRVLFYLDDLIVMASSRESVALHTAELVKHLSLLGFTVNLEKSSPLPSQSIIYLGVRMNSLDMKARLSPDRLEVLNALLLHFLPHKVMMDLSVMRLLDMMSVSHMVVPPGLLHMRRIQRWFSRLHLNPSQHKRRMLTIPSALQKVQLQCRAKLTPKLANSNRQPANHSVIIIQTTTTECNF